jgi:excisionase family DNA binding protein
MDAEQVMEAPNGRTISWPKGGKGKLVHQLNAPSPMMTAEEVAVMVRPHVRTIHRLARSDEIPHVRVGADFRFIREEIKQWCKDRIGQP